MDKRNMQLIIYGAGDRGKGIYNYLEKKGLQNIIKGFCDKHAEEIKYINEKKVYCLEEAALFNCPFIISQVEKEVVDDIKKELSENGCKYVLTDQLSEYTGEDKAAFNHNFTVFFHENGMDKYFQQAEEGLDVFWGKDSKFNVMFQKLDLSKVMEFACGRGRHVEKYVNNANEITLVDVLPKNIEICKERYRGNEKITYYCNNGKDLSELNDNEYSSIFTYDSMVHFELIDIANYLKEFYRVLQPNGYALVHHSNNDSDYKYSFTNAPYGRSFMNRNIFANLAYRAGFTIVHQETLDWGIPNLDCLTLLKKE